MPSAHERIQEAVNERLRIAEATLAGPGYGALSLSWPRTPGKDALVDFLNANDPARIIRDCQRDLRVLERHAPFLDKQWVGVGALLEHPDVRSADGWWIETRCRGCEQWTNAGESHYAWPCDEIKDLCEAYQIDGSTT